MPCSTSEPRLRGDSYTNFEFVAQLWWEASLPAHVA